jgi:hypothetical protein
MKLRQWLAVIGAMGVAAGAASWAAKPVEGAKPPDADLVAQDTSVANYLAEGGPVDKFNKKVVASICQLEEKNKDKLESGQRLCPTGNPEQVTKPIYPPK